MSEQDLIDQLRSLQAGWWRKVPEDEQPPANADTWVEEAKRVRLRIAEQATAGVPEKMVQAALAAHDAALPGQLEYIRNAAEPLYDAPGVFLEFQRIVQLVARGAADLGMGEKREMVVGTGPTGQLSAMSHGVNDGRASLVLFDAGLLVFGGLVAKAAARCYPLIAFHEESDTVKFSTDVEQIVPEIAAYEDATVRRYAEALKAYLVDGHPATAPQYIGDLRWNTLVNSLYLSFSVFVVAHEYAHLISDDLLPGHLAGETILPLLEISRVDFSWGQELHADEIGGKITRQVLVDGGYSPSQTLIGAVMFLASAEIAELGIHSLREGSLDAGRRAMAAKYSELSSSSSTHPPHSMRIDELRALVRDLGIDHQGWPDVGQLGQLVAQRVQAEMNFDLIVEVMSRLNGFAEHAISALIANGFKLHKKWVDLP